MIYTRAILEVKKMSELREIGRPFGAKDTSKEELINEILNKQPKPKGESDTGKIISKLERFEGDFVQTYDLRYEIIEKLRKLKKLEEE